MNTITIWRKELNSYFRSPIAYGVMAFFGLISGYFFYVAIVFFVQASIQNSIQGQGQPMSVNEQVIRPIFSNISVIGLFLIPMITMRLFAEEKRSGTIELLVTSPIRDLEIIVGKWLAAMLLYCCLLLFTVIHFLFLFKYGNPDWKPVLIAYLGLLLEAGAMLAIGTFISSLTKNQIIAGAVTFAVCLLLWIFEWVSEFETATWAQVLSYTSITTHAQSFAKGL